MDKSNLNIFNIGISRIASEKIGIADYKIVKYVYIDTYVYIFKVYYKILRIDSRLDDFFIRDWRFTINPDFPILKALSISSLSAIPRLLSCLHVSRRP